MKTLYTLRRWWRNKAKSIASTGCYLVDTIKEVYGLTVLYRHIYAVKGTILSHFSRPKVTLKTIVKVIKLDAGTPSCTQTIKFHSFHAIHSALSVKISPKRPKMCG